MPRFSDVSTMFPTTKLMVHRVDLMTDTNMQRRRNKRNITNARVIRDTENNLKNETLFRPARNCCSVSVKLSQSKTVFSICSKNMTHKNMLYISNITFQ